MNRLIWAHSLSLLALLHIHTGKNIISATAWFWDSCRFQNIPFWNFSMLFYLNKSYFWQFYTFINNGDIFIYAKGLCKQYLLFFIWVRSEFECFVLSHPCLSIIFGLHSLLLHRLIWNKMTYSKTSLSIAFLESLETLFYQSAGRLVSIDVFRKLPIWFSAKQNIYIIYNHSSTLWNGYCTWPLSTQIFF